MTDESTSEDRGLGLRDYWRILLTWWWVLLLGPVSAAVAAFFISSAVTPTYQAKAKLLVQGGQTSEAPFLSEVAPSEGARNYRDLIKTRPILEQVVRELSLPYSPSTLSGKISVSSTRSLIEITVSDPNPQTAAKIANTSAEVFINDFRNRQFAQIAQFQASLGQHGIVEGIVDDPRVAAAQATIIAAKAATLSTLSIIEKAVPPSSASSPRIRLNMMMAAFLGLMLAGLVVFLLEYLDESIKSPNELRALTGVPVLGTVMRLPVKQERASTLLDQKERSSPLAESYKFLSTNLKFAGDRVNGLKTILVTSSSPMEGKTTTAVNLAASSAAEGKSVILVDSDLRKPSLQRIFDIKKDQNGLPQLLSGSTTLDEVLTTTRIEGLRVIPSGPETADATLILRSLKMEMLIKELKSRADLVVLDSPPLLSVTDAMLLAPLVDGVLLVVDARSTKRDALKRAAETLQQASPAVVGTVLINVTAKDMGYYYDYYPYYSHDGAEASNERRGLIPKVLRMRKRK